MGFDKALKQGPETGAQGPVSGEVVELLPSATYRVRLEDEAVVTAHATGASRANFVRLRPGDRVRVELSPRDRTRGRITELLENL